MFAAQEMQDICNSEDVDERRGRLRRAIVGKFAYYRTTGQAQGRKWSQVVLSQEPLGEAVAGGMQAEEEKAAAEQLGDWREEDSREAEKARHSHRHALFIGGASQNKWRCDFHDWRGYCVAVCRAPPDEALDPSGEFRDTLGARFLEVDVHDNVLDHTEPRFIEIPIVQLLPEKWHSDYERACGRGEKGEQLRMNYSGPRAPHVPNSSRAPASQPV